VLEPHVFVLSEHENQHHQEFVAMLSSQLGDEYRVHCTPIPVSEHVIDLYGSLLDRLDDTSVHALFTAKVVVNLTRNCALEARDSHQLFYAFCDHDGYTNRGLLVSDSRGTPSSKRIVRGFVFESPRAGHRTLSRSIVTFVEDTKTNRERFQMFWQAEHGNVLGHLSAPRLPRYIFAIKSFTDLEFVSPRLKEHLAREIANESIDVWIISPISEHALSRGGMPFSRYIAHAHYKKPLRPSDFTEDDMLFYPGFGTVTGFGLASHSVPLTYMPNLELLDYRREIDHDTLCELALDPGAFHLISLSGAETLQRVEQLRVDVIVPHYNTPLDHVERAIRSAVKCRETVPLTQIIVVDDGSEIDLGPQLEQLLGDDWAHVSFIRSLNGGPGPARNRGVAESDADYVYFLDADDEIFEENFAALCAQAIVSDCDMVVGRRVIVDSEGDFMDESLEHLFGSVVHRLKRSDNRVVDDHMITNKLVRREFIARCDISLPPGVYEDNWGACSYYGAAETLMLNVPIHRWYQYGSDESITKTKTPTNAMQKVASLEASWDLLNDEQRKRRVRYNLNYDLQVLISSFHTWPDEAIGRVSEAITSYVLERTHYIDVKSLSESGQTLFSAVEKGQSLWERCADEVAEDPDADHVFFPRTLFQVLEAIAISFENDWKSILVLPDPLPGFSEATVEKIRDLDLFVEVRTYRSNAVISAFAASTRLGSVGYYSMLKAVLSGARRDLASLSSDLTAFYFHDPWPENYFIRNHFERVCKLEDGYRSTEREIELSYRDGIWGHNLVTNGLWGILNLSLQGELAKSFPSRRPVATYFVANENGRRAINKTFPGSNVEVLDPKAILLQHKNSLGKRLTTAFGVVNVVPHSSVILTQPLFFDYCSPQEHLAVVAHLVSLAEFDNVYLKPHPMDPYDYSALQGVTVIDRAIPFEVIELADACFGEGVAFGTSALDNSSAIDHVRLMMPFAGFTSEDVVDRISQICSDLSPAARAFKDALFYTNFGVKIEDVVLDSGNTTCSTVVELPLLEYSESPVETDWLRNPKWRSAAISARTAARLLVTDRSEFAKASKRTIGEYLWPR